MNYSENLTTHVLNTQETIQVKEKNNNLKAHANLTAPISIDNLINTNRTSNQEELHPKLATNIKFANTPIVMLTRKADLKSKRQKLRTPQTRFSDIEELNAHIENLIAIREELKKQYRRGDITHPLEIKIETWDQKFLHRLSSYIKSNISNPELNVTLIMCRMHMSRTQLHRKIKALTGLSTTEFIRTVRLKRAAQLLIQNTDSVTQIGYQIGFSDHSYFAKCFKRKYGVSPSEYSKTFLFS